MKSPAVTLKQCRAALQRNRLSLILAALSAVLIICLIICISMYMNMHSKYSTAAHRIQSDIYSCLDKMCDEFDGISTLSEEEQRRIMVPEMRAQYRSAVTLNELLVIQFGPNSAVLTSSQISALDNAFGEYDTAYRYNGTTGLAEADMKQCVAEISRMVDAYNAPANPTPAPVEITYGK